MDYKIKGKEIDKLIERLSESSADPRSQDLIDMLVKKLNVAYRQKQGR